MNKETGEKENGSTDGYDSDEERVNVINQSILFSGELHTRNLFSEPLDVNNTIMFKDSFWSKRFAVIRSGVLLLYKSYGDVYDEDKDAMDEISLENILVIESSSEDSSEPDSNSSSSQEGSECSDSMKVPNIDCLFDLHARVQFGGDSQGIRVFSFYSSSTANCTDWMRNLCKAVGFLELVPASGGGYVSVISEAALMERKEQQLKRQVAMMRKSSIGGPAGDLRRLSSASQKSHSSHDDDRGNSPAQGRGRGRGRAFRGLSQQTDISKEINRELEAENILRERKAEEDGKKEKQLENVHRNHFREISLTGGGGRAWGRGHPRGSVTRLHRNTDENGEITQHSSDAADQSIGSSMGHSARSADHSRERSGDGHRDRRAGSFASGDGFEEDKEDPHKHLEDLSEYGESSTSRIFESQDRGENKHTPDRNVAIHTLMKDRPNAVFEGRGGGRGAPGRGRGRGRAFETSPN